MNDRAAGGSRNQPEGDTPHPALSPRTLEALLQSSRVINDEIALHHVFEEVTRQAATVLNAQSASLLMLDADGRKLVFRAPIGPAAADLQDLAFDANEGIAGQVLRDGKAICVADVQSHPTFFKGIDAATGMKTTSLIAAPLIHRGKPLGVIEVLNPQTRNSFNDEDVEVLEIFANLAAAAVRNAQQYAQVTRENAAFRGAQPEATIIGKSQVLAAALELCRRVAKANTTVLITGETGTGKEMAARMVHETSERSGKPFIAVNCAALPETLLESELFGHEQGAFTGADRKRQGRFELAEGGTLFLDEIGEMSLATQAKLLRVLQEREFVRVGGSVPIQCNVRLIAATNRDLKQEIEAGSFREDLFYRLSVFPIDLPPLRDRRDDVPLLVDHFVNTVAREMGVHPPPMQDAALSCLMQHDWPGNIRELRNVVERCLLLSDREIDVVALPPEIAALGGHGAGTVSRSGTSSPGESTSGGGGTLESHEKALMLRALEQVNWNQSAAARELGISRDKLRYRIEKYGIKPPGNA